LYVSGQQIVVVFKHKRISPIEKRPFSKCLIDVADGSELRRIARVNYSAVAKLVDDRLGRSVLAVVEYNATPVGMSLGYKGKQRSSEEGRSAKSRNTHFTKVGNVVNHSRWLMRLAKIKNGRYLLSHGVF